MPLDLLPVPANLIYRRNYLASVICQIRFHPILRILEALPVDFQESVREEFPALGRVVEGQWELKADGPAQIVSQGSTWRFESADKGSAIVLGAGSVAVEVTSYKRFDHLRRHMELALESVSRVYGTTRFIRAGLRYINKFDHKEVEDLITLFNPALTGDLAASPIDSYVKQYQTVLLLHLDSARINIIHGKLPDSDYVLDLDEFIEREIGGSEVLPTLDDFNDTLTRLFRWCISDELHERMEPYNE